MPASLERMASSAGTMADGSTVARQRATSSSSIPQYALWKPRLQTFRDLFWKGRCIPRELERLDRKHSRSGVVPVPARAGWNGEAGNDHIRTKLPNDSH